MFVRLSIREWTGIWIHASEQLILFPPHNSMRWAYYGELKVGDLVLSPHFEDDDGITELMAITKIERLGTK